MSAVSKLSASRHAHAVAAWFCSLVAVLCAALSILIGITPYTSFLSYWSRQRELTPLSISIPVLLAGALSALLVRRWRRHSKVFVWVVSLVLWFSFLLYLTVMIFVHFNQERETLRM
jgi:hypothetical protein